MHKSLLHLLTAALLVASVRAQAEYDSENQTMFQGDIMLTPEQQATLEATANPNDPFSPQAAVVRNERSLWPSARVPYIIDSSLGTAARNAIQAAIDEYRRLTCVEFVPRTSQDADYVRFFRGSGCFSFIGRVSGPQDISIGQGCEFRGIVMHEMFHALGRWHEQSRPDRDQFVRINTQNIQPGVENNFETTPSTFVTTQGVPYDTRSIMHYGAFAFSRNGQPTIEPVDSRINLRDLGQRDGFTNSDVQHVNTLYCGGQPSGSWSQWGSWSSCSRTCNGGTRTRARTCQGGTDCSGSNIDTQQCNTQACPVPASWGAWTAWGSCSATCGGGRQQRTRRCVGGNTCSGRNAEFRDCQTQNCPQPATWGSWGSWSSCSATCQGGVRQRTRRCQNGNTCPGAGLQNQFCNSNIPCTSQPNPNTGEWSSWSTCTRSCGGGTRFRARMCGGSNCESQQQSCNTQDCNPEPNLRALRHRGCYFVPRFSSTLDLFEGLTPDLSDDPLTRQNPIGKCGAGAQQFGYNFFAVSVGYCISGSRRLSDYQYISSTFCNNGVGGYISGYFVMDVYEVVDAQVFLDSVSQVPTTTEEVPTTTESSADNEFINSAPVISTNLTLLLSLAIVTVLGVLFH